MIFLAERSVLRLHSLQQALLIPLRTEIILGKSEVEAHLTLSLHSQPNPKQHNCQTNRTRQIHGTEMRFQ